MIRFKNGHLFAELENESELDNLETYEVFREMEAYYKQGCTVTVKKNIPNNPSHTYSGTVGDFFSRIISGWYQQKGWYLKIDE